MVRMAAWVGVLSLAVKLRPLPEALSLITTSSRPKSVANPQTQQFLAATLDKVLQANVVCLEPVCWKRAAVLHRYLALSGTVTTIVFGMRKDSDGTIRGHAWLETDGSPLLETTPPDYTVTYTFPSNEQFKMGLTGLNLTSD